jgi:hypothetical protein
MPNCSIVVICFQTLDLRSLITTPVILIVLGCDLLSNFRYSCENKAFIVNGVVICFQTLDLRSLITTGSTTVECDLLSNFRFTSASIVKQQL